MGTWGGRGGAGWLWAAKPRDGNRKKTLLGSVAPNCCHPVPQLVGSQRPMGSGNGRSLSDLSTEPRRRWRIYEPRRGSSLPDSKSLRGGEKTRLLLSSTPSIPRGNLWLGDIPGLWCPPPSKAAGRRDEAGRTLPVGLVPNSSWVLHSGLQDELPDPHSLAACKEPRCRPWGSRLQPSQTPPAAPRNTLG